MATAGTRYVCEACGKENLRWEGRCPGCGEWNTLAEGPASFQPSTTRAGPPVSPRPAMALAVHLCQ